MFNHQYNFDIEIPKEVITEKKHDKIFEELLENKVLIGLCGYGKSGKDFIAKKFIDNYGFHRVAFADNIKIEMNEHLKESVFEFLKKYNEESDDSYVDLHGGHELIDGRVITVDDIDFQTEDKPLKKRIRPFIIWYGEKLREVNGPYYWINQAFKIDAKGFDKIILSDVRRNKELEIFENSNSQAKRTRELFAAAGCIKESPIHNSKSYSSLLFHVSQLGLEDSDKLTHECIRIAQENWLFDDEFKLDPRLPEEGSYRETAMSIQIADISLKHKIKLPEKDIAYGRQMSILDDND